MAELLSYLASPFAVRATIALLLVAVNAAFSGAFAGTAPPTTVRSTSQ